MKYRHHRAMLEESMKTVVDRVGVIERNGDEAGPLPRYTRGKAIIAYSLWGSNSPQVHRGSLAIVRDGERKVLQCDTKDLRIIIPTV